ncbi:hypothetical protein C2845_PM16G09540 [Panicum miliaceum]|uniref:Cell number regulator 2-like n=1 Tax=Panicum miliaceum TaxID=4540 RepID=A0A3L6PT79_PANMI|nr:hypothetical protein C2845_PM16G09540 [Panicum miliaceum]
MASNGAPPAGEWSSGLFDCFDDVGGCGGGTCCVSGTLYLLLTAWTGGQPSVLTGGLGCLYSCSYRSKLRARYGLEEGPCRCPDCCVHFWCEPCALCQEYRELKARGFDMSQGWEENMERMGKAGAAATAPPHMNPGMSPLAPQCLRIWQMQPARSVYCQASGFYLYFHLCRLFVSTYVFGVVTIVRNHYVKIHA